MAFYMTFSEKPADFVYDGFLLRFLLRIATPTQRTARTADRTHPPPCESVGVQTVEEWDCFSISFLHLPKSNEHDFRKHTNMRQKGSDMIGPSFILK